MTDRPPSTAKALKALAKADPVMARLIETVPKEFVEVDDPDNPSSYSSRSHYGALLRAITGQQLSVKAAAAIHGRVLGFFGGETPTPQQILAADPEELRAAGGLSRAKTDYLRSLAEHVVSGELELEKLDDLPDETVIEELVAVKGIGIWSAQMFLMFHLGRPDVLPTGDLGIRRAVMIEYELDELPSHDELTELAEAWAPHRTLACMYLWASVDAAPD